MSKLIDTLRKCSELYYNTGDLYKLSASECCEIEKELGFQIFESYPISVSDSLYDYLCQLGKEAYPSDPYWSEVGSKVSGFGRDVEIPFKAGSLEELHLGDFANWDFNREPLICSAKLDGVSCLLHYKDGKFVEAVSRGDGSIGKDITRHYLKIKGAVTEIEEPADLWVRGELIIPKKDFEYIKSVSNYKAARNTASGFINAKDTNELIAEHIHFVAYNVNSDSEIFLTDINYRTSQVDVSPVTTEYYMFDWLKLNGFEIPDKFWYNMNNSTPKEAEEFFISKVKELKSNYDYEIDGIVMTVNSHNKWNGFETGTYNPKYSRKFKVGGTDKSAETTVETITWQISKSGKLTPVLNIIPVKIQGVDISNVTANNYQWLSTMKCGVGSKIIVSRNGDVIPNVASVITPSEDYDLPSYKTKISGVNLVIDGDSNEEVIREQNIQRLLFFGKSLELDQWGYGNCRDIYDNTGITPETFCKLSDGIIHDIIGENGLKIEKSWNEKKKNLTEVELASACNAFGIGIGKRILQPIYDKYGTLNVSASELETIEGFAEKRIEQYISNVHVWLEIKSIAESNGIVFAGKTKAISDKFSGIVVGFTGVRDKELMEYINQNGGIAQDSMTSKTNILVAKDPNASSSKLVKAREKGIEIISLEEARNRFMGQ